MSVRVRRLDAKDKAAWLDLFKGYIAFYKATVADEVIETTWQRLMAGSPDFHIALVAVDEADTPIGLAHVLFHRSTWSPDPLLLPGGPVRGPGATAQGASGRALIEATYREADARQCTRTYWVTQEFNYRARALYDQLATKSPFVQYRR